VTSSDAPQPPGSDDSKDAPPVAGETSQDDDAADLQEENAETSLDQPSS
jgi:hypothetical protein